MEALTAAKIQTVKEKPDKFLKPVNPIAKQMKPKMSDGPVNAERPEK